MDFWYLQREWHTEHMSGKAIKYLIPGTIVLGVIECIAVIVFHDQILKVLIGSMYDVFIKPPERSFCLDTTDEYTCILNRAIQMKDPGLCWYLDAGRSDMCAEEVMRAVPDASLCKKMKQRSLRNNCLESFKDKATRP